MGIMCVENWAYSMGITCAEKKGGEGRECAVCRDRNCNVK